MSSKIPLAIPALLADLHATRDVVLCSSLPFLVDIDCFIIFGSVAFQEYLEFTLKWPWWGQGRRVGIEEGTELLGFFCSYPLWFPQQPAQEQLSRL
jgi:hypothetical protein